MGVVGVVRGGSCGGQGYAGGPGGVTEVRKLRGKQK